MEGDRKFFGFFYLSFLDDPKSAQKRDRGELGWNTEGVYHLLSTYGISRFLKDIDDRKSYPGDTLIGSVLNWASGEGFSTLFNSLEFPYDCASMFRDRYIIQLLKGPSNG